MSATDTLHDAHMAGRVVLVTGAHGGLGQAAALALARAGAQLILLGHKLPKLNRVYDAILAAGGQALLYPLDLEGATPDDFADLAARIDAEYGHLDGLVHCAAHFRNLTPLELTDPADLARALHINLSARCWLTQACLPLLRKSTQAAVVFALDTAATGAYWGGYGLAQAALMALVPMLQAELGAACVRVSGWMPGPLRTPLRARAFADDAHHARDPAHAAKTCLRLLSPAGEAWRGKIWTPDASQGAM